MIPGSIRRWFELTRDEQLWIAAILAIFLVGLVARWHHSAQVEPVAETEVVTHP